MRERIVEALAIGSLALLLAIALSAVYDTFGVCWLLCGTGVSVIVVFGLVALVNHLWKSKVETTLADAIEETRRLAAHAKFPWLRSNIEIKRIEQRPLGKEIWVVSPDLQNDTGMGEFVAIVQRNAARGHRYVYIVPQTDPVVARTAELKEVFAKWPAQLVLRRLPKADFDLLTRTHVTVYNPRSEQAKPGRAFLELPIDGRGWWVEMSDHDAASLIGRLTLIVDEKDR